MGKMAVCSRITPKENGLTEFKKARPLHECCKALDGWGPHRIARFREHVRILVGSKKPLIDSFMVAGDEYEIATFRMLEDEGTRRMIRSRHKGWRALMNLRSAPHDPNTDF